VEIVHFSHLESGEELRPARVPEIKKVIDAMQNSPTAAYLVHCSEHERIMLAATLKCIRKNGTETVKWGEVSYSKKKQFITKHFY
jgi:origin recognition complex subunit 1